MSRQDWHSSRYGESGQQDPALRRAERVLFSAPICVAVAIGAGLMLVRFILVLKDNLRSAPDSWAAVMLLALIIGGASIVVIAACATAGAIIGLFLQALLAKRLAGRYFAGPMLKRRRV